MSDSRLYHELAEWYLLVSPPSDYAEEAPSMLRILEGAGHAGGTMLELGCGSGSLASHLKARFRLTLTDRSPRMLEVCRGVNPDCEILEGDMRSLRLGRLFDAVLIHDAIIYATEEADVRAALATAAAHCRPGGAVVVAPDHVRETFQPSTTTGGHDGPDGRALRFLEWCWDPDASDTTYEVAFAFLLREADGSVRIESDRHPAGVFAESHWLRMLAEAGLRAHSTVDEWARHVFVACKA
jgi:SAM-dependent methyltransferase